MTQNISAQKLAKMILFIVLSMVCFAAFSKGATADAAAADQQPLWALIGVALLSVFELLFRIVPTTRNISLLSLIYKMINAIVPNRTSGGGRFK